MLSARTLSLVGALALSVAMAVACSQLPDPQSPSASQACSAEIVALAPADATCAIVAPQLYEFTYTDGRKAWCRDEQSRAWCSQPVAPAGAGSGHG